MLLLGNDIVDLLEAGSRDKHRDARFVARVFTGHEQATIRQSAFPNETLWLLWAAKETAYKIVSKFDAPPVFRHRDFQIEVLSPLDAQHFPGTVLLEVCYREITMSLEVSVNDKYVHAIGVLAASSARDTHRIVADVHRSSASEMQDWQARTAFPDGFSVSERQSIRRAESAWVRWYCKQAIAASLSLDPARLQILRPVIGKKTQPPFLLLDDQKTGIDVSFSHHGRYLAWAFSMPEKPDFAPAIKNT